MFPKVLSVLGHHLHRRFLKDPLFLEGHLFHLALWLLLLRWHRLFPMVQQYLEHPKFPKDR